MKPVIRFFLITTLLISFIYSDSNAQAERDWWNSLSPGWKKVFRDQELKGKDVVPNDEQLDRMVKISHIDCSENKDIEDLKPLKMCTLLEEIRCNNTGIKSLEGIEGLTNLRKLDCSNNDNISSLIPLRGLASLEELNCGNTMIKDLSPLRGMANLKKLDVHFCTVNKLLVIGELKKLEILDVSKNQSLFDLVGMETLVNLREFDCSETQVNNLAPLSLLKKLEILDVSKTAINTLRPIQQLKSLKELDASETAITAASLDYLYAHVALEMLRARSIDATTKQIDEFQTTMLKKIPNCTFVITPK